MSRIVLVGHPDHRRTHLFQAAAVSRGVNVTVCPWHDVLRDPGTLADTIHTNDIVRIDSPGENSGVEAGLISLGMQATEESAASHSGEYGQIENTRLWYHGLTTVLQQMQDVVSCQRGIGWMNHPEDIALMFDKSACQHFLADSGICVPPVLGTIHSYAELRSLMRGAGVSRVFLKPPHSSSASGVVAFQAGRTRLMAQTSVEVVRDASGLKLYNSLNVRRYTQESQIAELIDALGPSALHVERWIPKAGLGNRTFDLRVVVIAGRACHVVVRTSRTPMTNLHLGNQRGDLAQLQATLPDHKWHELLESCEQTAACFPRSLSMGIDVALTSDWRRHYVLEVNAFGDLLPNVLHNGCSTYEAQVDAMIERHGEAPSLMIGSESLLTRGVP